MSPGKLIVGLALFSAGFFWPVEDAVSGSGLHLVILWMIFVAGIGLFAWRFGNESNGRFRFGLADVGIILLVVGHLVSTLTVFHDQADRRSALNLSFESVGLLIQWFCMRHWAAGQRSFRSLLASVVCCLAIGLAAYGIWQSHVFYPEQADWYRSRREVLDRAAVESRGDVASKASEALREFQSRGIPLEGASRKLWENRLLSSSEPFATFSLANTLAGVLATAFVLMVGIALSKGEQSRITAIQRAAMFVAAAIVAWCLVLTKSRSAWAGAIAGTLILILQLRQSVGSRRLIMTGGIAAMAACVVFGVAALIGAIDKEVVLESPRSLQFRLMYWTGSIDMLKQYPIFGPGPGNFRNAYLQFRADESSEEIRDPHNFILEAWSSAGVIGLAGLAMLIWSVLRCILQPTDAAEKISEPQPTKVTKPNRRQDSPSRMPYIAASAITFGLMIHLAWEWLNGAPIGLEELPLLLLLVGAPFAGILQRRISTATTASASIAMMTHLLAAGGFSMPAVMSVLLAMIAVSVTAESSASPGTSVMGTVAHRFALAKNLLHHPLLLSAVAVSAAFVVFRGGLLPVLTCRQDTALGDLAFQQRDFERARTDLLKAAESDRYSVTPRQRLAELESYRLEEIRKSLARVDESQPPDRNDSESELVRLQDAVRRRLDEIRGIFQHFVQADRRSAYAIRRKALGLASIAEILRDEEMFREAVALQNRAAELYPSSLETWIELVRTAQQMESVLPGRNASIQELIQTGATRALHLDSINHSWGHSDRYLDDDTIRLLKSAAGDSTGNG